MGGADDGDCGLRIAVRKDGITISDPAAAYLADLLYSFLGVLDEVIGVKNCTA